MSNRMLDKSEWQGYFDQLSKDIAANEVEIEVSGLDFGDQVDVEWITLEGVSYDPKDDVFFVMTENYEHAIQRPKQIAVDGDAATVRTISVVGVDQNPQMIRLKEPLVLAAAKSA